MKISMTFRHVEATEAIKKTVDAKISRLQRFLRKPSTARVTVSLDKLSHAVEVRLSSGGEHYEASESSEDMYASIDRVVDKLERQIRGSKGATQAKQRRRSSRGGRVADGAES